MSRNLSTRLSRLECGRRSKTLRSGVVVYPPDATEEQIETLVQEHLRAMPAGPTRRIVLVSEQYETCEAWEASDHE